MMALSAMRAVIDTIDEAGHSPLAHSLAAPWAPDAAPTFFRASANVLFTFEHAGHPRVLRFVEPARRTVSEIAAEIAFINYLDSAGIPVARPTSATGGETVVAGTTQLGIFNAAAFERVPGEHLELSDLSPEQLALWGSALGQLHRAAAAYKGGGRRTWQDRLAMVAGQLDDSEPAARRALAAVDTRLRALPVAAETFGLLHGDFELDNLLWDGARFTAIDFDDSFACWFAADIAFALRDAFDDSARRIDLDQPAVAAFVAGYRTQYALAAADLARLPLFMLLHHLITFARIKRALGRGAVADAPAWLTQLRQKLHGKLERYRAEFAAPAA